MERGAPLVVNSLALAALTSGFLVLAGWYTQPIRWVLAAALLALTILWRRRSAPTIPAAHEHPTRVWASTSAIAASFTAAVFILAASGTMDSIRSPWSIVPGVFFPLVALTAMASLIAPLLTTVGIAAVLALGSLVAIFVYPLGFGFDHFLHAEAERIIATTGALSPPPFFSSAHYGLVVLLHDLLAIPIDLADRILVPVLAVLILPPLAHRALMGILSSRSAALGTVALCIVPFLPLAVSTPQALANIFALSTVLLLANGAAIRSVALPTTAAILAQPLTGLPLAAVIAIAALLHRGRRVAAAIAGVLGALAIPIAFALAPIILPNIDVRIMPVFARTGARIARGIANALAFTPRDLAHADALAIARIALPLVWVILTLLGARILSRAHHRRRGALVAGPVIALAASVLVDATVTFPTQLPEEHAQFPLRLLSLAALLATPLAGIGLGSLAERVRSVSSRAALVMALGVLAIANLTLAYPRDDAQARSGLWSVSVDDIVAVHAIANDAGDARYIVLANQMLGAAAVREFGFRPSSILADGREIMAFPLPAGGPIARQFWSYVSQSPLSPVSTTVETGDSRASIDRTPVDAAMDLVGASRAYVVLHDYWRNYERLAAATAEIADAEVGTFTHLRVFRFNHMR